MNGIAVNQRISPPAQAVTQDDQSILVLLNQLNSRLRSTTDQLRTITGIVKCGPANPDSNKPCRSDIHGALLDAHDVVSEYDALVQYLCRSIG